LTRRIKSLEEENDTVQKTLLYKEEEIEEFKELMNAKSNQVTSLNERIKELENDYSLNLIEKNKQI
jgi:predicted  nucleic acid-binding Zn-ribbon protein